MNSEADDALTRLHNIVLYIKWKVTDDPWLADAVKYLESPLVYHDEEYCLVASDTEEPVKPWDDCYFEEDWDEYWDESDWCSGSTPCEENCDAEWGGCQWLVPPEQGPVYHTWEFSVGGTLYQLRTPQMTLCSMDYYRQSSRSRRIPEFTAEAILDAINLMIVAEITEI